MRTQARRRVSRLLLLSGLLAAASNADAQLPALSCQPTGNGSWRALDRTGAIYTLEPDRPADYPTKDACQLALRTALSTPSVQHCLAASDWTSRVPDTDALIFYYHVRLTSSCPVPLTCQIDTVPGGRSTLALLPGASRVVRAVGQVGILPSFRYACQ